MYASSKTINSTTMYSALPAPHPHSLPFHSLVNRVEGDFSGALGGKEDRAFPGVNDGLLLEGAIIWRTPGLASFRKQREFQFS